MYLKFNEKASSAIDFFCRRKHRGTKLYLNLKSIKVNIYMVQQTSFKKEQPRNFICAEFCLNALYRVVILRRPRNAKNVSTV